jgi:hypothetical protein
MDARFFLDKKAENKFIFRIHNGSHANRDPERRTLDICFWVEGMSGTVYEPVSDKKCELIDMKADSWRKLELEVYDLALNASVIENSKLTNGVYNVKVSAREQKGGLMKLIFGASLERLSVEIVVKDGLMIEKPIGSWK